MADYNAGDLYGSLTDGQRAVVDAIIAPTTARPSFAVGPQEWLVPLPRFQWPVDNAVPIPMRLLRYRHQLQLAYAVLELAQ